MNKISVLIPTFNSEKYIEAVLASVSWADEIVIVDSFSTDNTLEICRKYKAVIYQNHFIHAANQKNWALPKCSHDWVLQIDSDEEAEPGMEKEIRDLMKNPELGISCYLIPRKNYIYGQWLKTCGYYPDTQTRLFNKSECSFEDKAVHERVLTHNNQYGRLSSHIIHHDFKDLTTHLNKINRYATYHMQELIKKNHRLSTTDLFLRPPLVFFHRWIILGGISQGYVGFLQSFLVALEVFLKYAKFWEYQWQNNHRK